MLSGQRVTKERAELLREKFVVYTYSKIFQPALLRKTRNFKNPIGTTFEKNRLYICYLNIINLTMITADSGS